MYAPILETTSNARIVATFCGRSPEKKSPKFPSSLPPLDVPNADVFVECLLLLLLLFVRFLLLVFFVFVLSLLFLLLFLLLFVLMPPNPKRESCARSSKAE
jgi:hypothetical protein